MEIKNIVRSNIKILMHQKKVSINDIITKYNISKSTMYKHLRGDLCISLEKLDMIKDALNVSFSLILSEQFYNINKNTKYANMKYYPNLNDKETYERNKTIYYHRVISDKKKTLQELGTMFNISRERVRQIQCEVVKRKLNE